VTEPAHLAATRAFYEAVAEDYVRVVDDELDRRPLERGLLASFAELVLGDGGGPVADLGCGPGRLTAHLAGLGLDTFGVDLSPRMVEVARSRHPAFRFEVGSLTGLDLPDGALAGALAWYSLIHLPAEQLPVALAELRRVLRPGGRLLLAFKAGAETRRAQGYGNPDAPPLDVHWLPPEQVASRVREAGLEVHAELVRAADPDERQPQAFLLARKPG
jgi:SAM-dependent methyltransferase